MTDESKDVLLQGVTEGRMLHGRSCDIYLLSLQTLLLQREFVESSQR